MARPIYEHKRISVSERRKLDFLGLKGWEIVAVEGRTIYLQRELQGGPEDIALIQRQIDKLREEIAGLQLSIRHKQEQLEDMLNSPILGKWKDR